MTWTFGEAPPNQILKVTDPFGSSQITIELFVLISHYLSVQEQEFGKFSTTAIGKKQSNHSHFFPLFWIKFFLLKSQKMA